MKTLILAVLLTASLFGQAASQMLMVSQKISAGSSPPSILTSASAGGIGGATTSAVDTTGATMLFVVISDDTATSAVADSKSNTWRHLPVYSGASKNSIWYSYDKSGSALVVGAGHTVTVSTGTAPYFVFAAANNTSTSPTDPYTGNQNGFATGAVLTIQPGTVTPSGTSLIVAGLSFYTNTGTASVDTGFTIIAQSPLVGGQNYAGAAAYLVGSSAVNPTWTLNNGTPASLSASIAIFK